MSNQLTDRWKGLETRVGDMEEPTVRTASHSRSEYPTLRTENRPLRRDIRIQTLLIDSGMLTFLL